ncbi:MAG: biotin transporter BioY [Oscillospiraceae bacterium]|nr:biotin transporter BioY [Oscillospiraceae bacterium]
MKSENKSKTLTIMLCALFAGLSIALSPVKIPIGPIPVGLVHISIFLSAGLLGWKKAAISQTVFVLIGLAGVPIFAPSGLPGATGGFIISYIACAFVTGLIIEKFGLSYPVLFIAMTAGWAATYLIGVPWFMYVTKSEFIPALTMSMLPFLPGDAVKTVMCAVLIKRLAPIVKKEML